MLISQSQNFQLRLLYPPLSTTKFTPLKAFTVTCLLGLYTLAQFLTTINSDISLHNTFLQIYHRVKI